MKFSLGSHVNVTVEEKSQKINYLTKLIKNKYYLSVQSVSMQIIVNLLDGESSYIFNSLLP